MRCCRNANGEKRGSCRCRKFVQDARRRIRRRGETRKVDAESGQRPCVGPLKRISHREETKQQACAVPSSRWAAPGKPVWPGIRGGFASTPRNAGQSRGLKRLQGRRSRVRPDADLPGFGGRAGSFSVPLGPAPDRPQSPQDKPLQNHPSEVMRGARGEVAEWLKAHAWKVCIRETVSRVRIPLSPPFARFCTPARSFERCRAVGIPAVPGACAGHRQFRATSEPSPVQVGAEGKRF